MNKMSLAAYPLYSVPEITSFQELLDYTLLNYPDQIAFSTREKVYTYKDFNLDIQRTSLFFSKYSNHFFRIDISDKYIFSVIYFSVVLSGNIAVLSSNDDILHLSLPSDTIIIDESTIPKIFDKPYPFTKTVSPSSFSTLVCSSGTTSKKKGVMLSQQNLLSDTLAGMQVYEYRPQSRYVSILPFTHLFGIIADLLGSLLSGGTLCYGMNKLTFFEDLRFFNPDALNLPPALVNTIYKLLIQSGNKSTTVGNKLKKIMCAGAKIDDSCNKLFQKYGFTVFPAYGLTECSPCVCINRDLFSKPGSAGYILPCCSVKIIDGEIAVAGTNVMLGYYNAPEETNLVMRGEWLMTGDLGYLDSDQFLFITGRKSNLIVFDDGSKYLADEIESALNQIPHIKESLVCPSQTDPSKIEVIIVNDAECSEEKLSKSICHTLSRFCSKNSIHAICFQENLLSRNSLGKIIRNMQNA